jgi:hypothetical protein
MKRLLLVTSLMFITHNLKRALENKESSRKDKYPLNLNLNVFLIHTSTSRGVLTRVFWHTENNLDTQENTINQSN